MPVITIEFDRLRNYIDEDPSEFKKWIAWIGVDIEDVTDEYIKIEYNPNRPDYGTLIGILRTYKGLKNLERGIIKYNINNSFSKKYSVTVKSSVKNVRPYIATLVAKNIHLDEALLTELIEFQEDLHQGIGRKRRKISIGLHNFDIIKFPVKYKTVGSDFKFIPLESNTEMSIHDILAYHPKGIEYGYILEGVSQYPILIDREGKVLSFPPIINGIDTIVTVDTRNLFIDVTGIDFNLVLKTIDILAATLHDYGAELYLTQINDPEVGIYNTPKLEYDEIEIDIDDVNRLLGLNLSLNDIISSIEASRLGVKSVSGKKIKVIIPPYRIDILHPVDIIEDIAIGYGFWKLKPDLNIFFTIGSLDTRTIIIEEIVDTLVGLGFQETIHSHLSNLDILYNRMNFHENNYLEVEHSKTPSYKVLRTWIIPQLLESLEISKKEEYPQKIFEIGYVFNKSNIEDELHLACAIAGPNVSYNDIKAVLDSIMMIYNKKGYTINPIKHSSFIPGRVGKIYYNETDCGVIGEIHPDVLLNFKLEVPIACLEIDVKKLFNEYFI